MVPASINKIVIRPSSFVLLFFLLCCSISAQSLLPDRLWGTYYGGLGNEIILSMYSDMQGNIILCGETTSEENIATSGAHQVTLAGEGDAFLVKFSPEGIRLWGTYFGGTLQDVGWCCRTDSLGKIYLSGHTLSSSGIATPGAHQTTLRGERDAFLAKFSAEGQLLWATYYGGSIQEAGYACDVAPDGTVYLTGFTNSPDFISTPGSHQLFPGGDYDGFLVKFSFSGQRAWGTYYGGSGTDAGSGCRVSTAGDLFLTGATTSPAFIATPGSFQPVIGGDYDAFLVKFSPDGQRVWGTYYGGINADHSTTLAADLSGNIFLSGYTQSPDNIASPGAYQLTLAGMTDGFVAKFTSAGNRKWGTYYGGIAYEEIRNAASGEGGCVYFAGHTYSPDGIASPGSFQSVPGGDRDAFLAKLDSSGHRIWGTYYGGAGDEMGYAASGPVVDEVYLSGYTGSTSGIATPGSLQSGFGGGDRDGFLVRFTETPAGIREVTSPDIRIYPNPSPGTFTVSGNLPGINPFKLTLTDLPGKEVVGVLIPSGKFSLRFTPPLLPGIYILQIIALDDSYRIHSSLLIMY